MDGSVQPETTRLPKYIGETAFGNLAAMAIAMLSTIDLLGSALVGADLATDSSVELTLQSAATGLLAVFNRAVDEDLTTIEEIEKITEGTLLGIVRNTELEAGE